MLLFFIKIQPNMSEQEKKQQTIYELLNLETKSKFLCLQSKENFLQRNCFLKERGEWWIEQKTKRRFFNC